MVLINGKYIPCMDAILLYLYGSFSPRYFLQRNVKTPVEFPAVYNSLKLILRTPENRQTPKRKVLLLLDSGSPSEDGIIEPE